MARWRSYKGNRHPPYLPLRNVIKHRKARDGKGFLTVACARSLDKCKLPDCETVLLEDLGNLCANELFATEAPGNLCKNEPSAQEEDSADVCEAILAGIRHVAQHCKHLVIVSVETALGGTEYGEDTVRFMEVMGRLHCALAKEADAVTEVVCGCPVFIRRPENNGRTD